MPLPVCEPLARARPSVGGPGGHSAQRGDAVHYFLRRAKVLWCSFPPRAAFPWTCLLSRTRTRGKLTRANTEGKRQLERSARELTVAMKMLAGEKKTTSEGRAEAQERERSNAAKAPPTNKQPQGRSKNQKVAFSVGFQQTTHAKQTAAPKRMTSEDSFAKQMTETGQNG